MASVSELTSDGLATSVHQLDEAPWRRFVCAFLSCVALLLAAIATLNFIVNPLALYPTHFFPPAVWNSRSIKAELLKAANPKPAVLILGSSRAMKISPTEVQTITGLPAFNASVDSAMAEDLSVMFHFAVEEVHARPELVIIGLDIEALHNATPPDYRLLQVDDFRKMLPHSEIEYRSSQLTDLFTLQQSLASVKQVRKMLRKPAEVSVQWDRDGYLHYLSLEAEEATGKYDLESKINFSIADYQGRFKGFTGVSTERLRSLDDTLRYARENHIKTIVYLTPLHAALIKALETRAFRDRRSEVIAAVQPLCQKYGARFFDFSSVDRFNGDRNGFYDGAHINERNATLLTRVLLGGFNAVQ